MHKIILPLLSMRITAPTRACRLSPHPRRWPCCELTPCAVPKDRMKVHGHLLGLSRRLLGSCATPPSPADLREHLLCAPPAAQASPESLPGLTLGWVVPWCRDLYYCCHLSTCLVTQGGLFGRQRGQGHGACEEKRLFAGVRAEWRLCHLPHFILSPCAFRMRVREGDIWTQTVSCRAQRLWFEGIWVPSFPVWPRVTRMPHGLQLVCLSH